MATRITLEMPSSALKRILDGWRSGDPMITAIFKEYGVISVQPHEESALAQWENEGGSSGAATKTEP